MLQSVGFTLFARLSGAILNFLSMVLLSRFLGPEARGVCSWYLVVIASSLVFSEMVAGPAAGYLLRKHTARVIRKAAFSWAVVPVVLVNSAFFLLGKIDFQEFMLLLISCWLNAAVTLQLHLLLAKQKIVAFNLLSLLGPALTLVMIYVFSKIDDPVPVMYLHAIIFSWMIAFPIGWLVFKLYPEARTKPEPIKTVFRDGFKYGIHNQAGHVASLLHNRLIYFLIPAGFLGIYANAVSLGEALLMLPGSIGQILYARVLNEREAGQGRDVAIAAWWVTLALMFLACIAVLILPDQLYQWVFGERFAGVKNYLLILVPGLLFYAGYLVMSYWQSANGRFIYNFYAISFGLVINLASCLTLLWIDHLTPLNATISMAAGWIVIFVVSALQFSRHNRNNRALFPPPPPSLLKKMVDR